MPKGIKGFQKGYTPWNKNMEGSKHWNWKGGITKSNGYIQIYSPKHPFHDHHGYVLEHRLIIEQHVGRYLTKEEVVHHKNKNTQDNRIENLQLFSSHSEHLKIHKINRWSRHLDFCVICNSSKYKHASKGVCRFCYQNIYRSIHGRSDSPVRITR